MEIHTHFNIKQQVFLDFVLAYYVKIGVEELDKEKLTPSLCIKYHGAIADAVADFGRPEEIAGEKGGRINPNKLGCCIKRNTGRVVNGLRCCIVKCYKVESGIGLVSLFGFEGRRSLTSV